MINKKIMILITLTNICNNKLLTTLLKHCKISPYFSLHFIINGCLRKTCTFQIITKTTLTTGKHNNSSTTNHITTSFIVQHSKRKRHYQVWVWRASLWRRR